MIRRTLLSVLLALPGIALAMAAKYFVWGEGVLFLGLLAAIVAPVVWLMADP